MSDPEKRALAVSEEVFYCSVVPGGGLDSALMDDRRIRATGHVLVGLQDSSPLPPPQDFFLLSSMFILDCLNKECNGKAYKPPGSSHHAAPRCWGEMGCSL